MYLQRFVFNNLSKDLSRGVIARTKLGKVKNVFKPCVSIVLHKHLHNNVVLPQSKQQYEYDAKTDSFRPKHQKSYTHPPQHSEGNNRYKNPSPFVLFIRRWMRNVFIITGGIVWGSMVFVLLFVDIKETTDFPLLVHDSDDDVRLLAFYDVGHNKGDLSKMVNSNGNKDAEWFTEDVHSSMHSKQSAFMDAIFEIKQNKKVEELLGKPVQLCGIKASKKLGRLMIEFKDVTFTGKNSASNMERDTWTAECLLEGSQGVASANIYFKRSKSNNWEVTKVTVDMLQSVYSYDIDTHRS